MPESEAMKAFGKKFSEAMFGGKAIRRFEDILPATITIVCHLCGTKFEAMVEKTDLADNYTLLENGTYDGSAADHWCDRCEEQDQTNITRRSRGLVLPRSLADTYGSLYTDFYDKMMGAIAADDR